MCDEHTWDQRIPNEAILARQFLLHQPPMILYPRPVTTYCTGRRPVGMDKTIPLTPSDEAGLRAYWAGFTSRDPHSGLLIRGAAQPLQPVSSNSNVWRTSVNYNIDADTTVKPYRPYRSKDCIPTESLPILEQQRVASDARARELMMSSLIQAPGPVWDQNTSRKLRWVDPRVQAVQVVPKITC